MTTKISKKLPPFAKLAEKAMRMAVLDVFKEHREKGLPIYVLEQNRIVSIPARRIPVR